MVDSEKVTYLVGSKKRLLVDRRKRYLVGSRKRFLMSSSMKLPTESQKQEVGNRQAVVGGTVPCRR